MSSFFTRRKFVQGIAQLLFYQTNIGNMDVAEDYVTPDRFPLGEFVKEVRSANRKGLLSEEQKNRLEEIGFAMDREDQNWSTMYNVVKRYVSENGGLPRATEKTQDYILVGAWVRRQRLIFYRLEKEKQDMLLQLGIQPEVAG